MLWVDRTLVLQDAEIVLRAVRSRGPGGQHGDKASTAIHLRFDITASTLPDSVKARLLLLPDERISKEGVVVIKADTFRSQDKNKADALARLAAIIRQACRIGKKRRPTKPTGRSREDRLHEKSQRGKVKKMRGKVSSGDI